MQPVDNTGQIIFEAIVSVILTLIVPFVSYSVINITTLKTDMKWVVGGLKILGDKAGVILHSPHTPDFDRLIEGFWHNRLSKDEARLLTEKLDAVIHEDPNNPLEEGNPYTEVQKSAASQMLAAVSAIERVKGADTSIIAKSKTE